jgi:hypothetical protein
MVALGIVVHFPRPGRPAASCVVARETSTGAPECLEKFQITSQNTDRARQLHALGQAVRSRVESLEVSAIWIRTPEGTARLGSTGSRVRLQAEGAILMGARDVAANVHVGDGKTIGQHVAGSKAAADRQGADLLSGSAAKDEYEAAAAALAALAVPPLVS